MLFLLKYGSRRWEAFTHSCRTQNRRCLLVKDLRLWLVVCLIAMVGLGGCNPQRKVVKAERLQERIEKKQEKEQAAAYEQARERHMKLQSKKTRQRMRQSAKRSEKYRGARKPSFWERLFGKAR